MPIESENINPEPKEKRLEDLGTEEMLSEARKRFVKRFDDIAILLANFSNSNIGIEELGTGLRGVFHSDIANEEALALSTLTTSEFASEFENIKRKAEAIRGHLKRAISMLPSYEETNPDTAQAIKESLEDELPKFLETYQ